VCVQAATLCLPQARDLFPGEEQDAPPGGGDEGGALTGKAAESHFCSKMVAEFFQHMGWMSTERPAASVMPSDFAADEEEVAESGAKLARPVVLQGGAALAPLEVLWSKQSGVQLPLKFKKAKLPLRSK